MTSFREASSTSQLRPKERERVFGKRRRGSGGSSSSQPVSYLSEEEKEKSGFSEQPQPVQTPQPIQEPSTFSSIVSKTGAGFKQGQSYVSNLMFDLTRQRETTPGGYLRTKSAQVSKFATDREPHQEVIEYQGESYQRPVKEHKDIGTRFYQWAGEKTGILREPNIVVDDKSYYKQHEGGIPPGLSLIATPTASGGSQAVFNFKVPTRAESVSVASDDVVSGIGRVRIRSGDYWRRAGDWVGDGSQSVKNWFGSMGKKSDKPFAFIERNVAKVDDLSAQRGMSYTKGADTPTKTLSLKTNQGSVGNIQVSEGVSVTKAGSDLTPAQYQAIQGQSGSLVRGTYYTSRGGERLKVPFESVIFKKGSESTSSGYGLSSSQISRVKPSEIKYVIKETTKSIESSFPTSTSKLTTPTKAVITSSQGKPLDVGQKASMGESNFQFQGVTQQVSGGISTPSLKQPTSDFSQMTTSLSTFQTKPKNENIFIGSSPGTVFKDREPQPVSYLSDAPQSPILRVGTRHSSGLLPATKTKDDQIILPKEDTDEIIDTRRKSGTGTGTSSIRFSRYTPPGYPGFAFPPMPFLPSGGGGFGKSRRSFKKQTKAYTPSAFSLVTGFKGKPTPFGIKSGLGARPIRKKRKKKK